MIRKYKQELVLILLATASVYFFFSGFQLEEINFFGQTCIQAIPLPYRPLGMCLRPEWMGLGAGIAVAAIFYWKLFWGPFGGRPASQKTKV